MFLSATLQEPTESPRAIINLKGSETRDHLQDLKAVENRSLGPVANARCCVGSAERHGFSQRDENCFGGQLGF